MEYVGGSIKRNIRFNIMELLSTTKSFEIKIPSSVLNRTKLMCMYIQDEVDCTFTINDFFMLLYSDFVKYAVKNYNPKRVLRETMRKDNNEDNNSLTIVIDDKKYIVKKENISYSTIIITMSKREIKKGEIILDELYDLYKYKIPFELLLANLWINFIEDYQNGVNKRAYTSIVKILKELYK